MPTLYVIRLADGTHYREPPAGHPNREPFCAGQMAARKFRDRAAAALVVSQRKLTGVSVVPYWYNR